MNRLLQNSRKRNNQTNILNFLTVDVTAYPSSLIDSTDTGVKSLANTNLTPVTTLFVDIGGVLLTDGWDHHARSLAAKAFDLNWLEMESRHQMIFATYEEGKMTLEQYLERTVFYTTRSFSAEKFREFMFAQSASYPLMIALIRDLKKAYGLKVFAVSNEARELNLYRIQKFSLNTLIDGFISSCFVHVRKPDEEIFQLALDIAQSASNQIVYIENTPMFVQIAEGLGIRSILHQDYQSTVLKLAACGLNSKLAQN